jgi:hypothetical protein
MACRALAAFFVSQLLVALDFLRERTFGLAPAAPVPNANAAWRLGDAAPVRGAHPGFGAFVSPRRIGIGLAGGALAFALTAAALGAGATPPEHALEIPYLCAPRSAALD